MVKNGKTFCYLGDHYEQDTFEYNKPKPITEDIAQNTVFTTKTKAKSRARSRMPRAPEVASAKAWHLKLAHTDPDIIAHLQNAVIGAKVDGKGPSTIECETCAVSKAKQIISRQPTPTAEKPYERIHWDLIPMTMVYNQDQYISHFVCDKTAMNHVYT